MVEKLTFLEMLKNNVGEEMAEMMSEEITKVMEEQRSIEGEYARLVEQRDQLKGITNKHRLEETKGEILVSHQTFFFRAVSPLQFSTQNWNLNLWPPSLSMYAANR